MLEVPTSPEIPTTPVVPDAPVQPAVPGARARSSRTRPTAPSRPSRTTRCPPTRTGRSPAARRGRAPLAADTGFTFADTFPIGLLFVGVAVFAAVGAMSHEHERAFSASLIYLGLGAARGALAIQLLDIEWLDPLEDAR